MASPLYVQASAAATAIAALTPTTDATATYVRSGTDLPLEGDIQSRDRLFDVWVDDAPPVTLRWHGTAVRVAKGRIRVSLRYDARQDQREASQRIAEDTDQIVSALESPSARQSDVDEVTFTDREVIRSEDGTFAVVSLVFDCEYRVTL